MYSIVAAKVHGARVFSFEPEGQNFATLNRNIMSNGCDDAITPYCIAILDQLRVDVFSVSYFTVGSALNSFGEALRTPQHEGADKTKLERFEPQHRPGSIALTVDDLIARGLPSPTFIKIDVDGFEDKVLAGAFNLIESAKRLHILVEADIELPEHRKMLKHSNLLAMHASDMQLIGFVSAARASDYAETSYILDPGF